MMRKLPNLTDHKIHHNWYDLWYRFSLAVFSFFIAVILLFSTHSPTFAQSTQCNGQADAFVVDSSFTNATIHAGTPFSITIYKCDDNSQIDTSYSDTATLSDNTRTVAPSTTSAFVAGVWTGTVTITKTAFPDGIAISTGNISGSSDSFVVNPGSQTFLAQLGGNAQSSVVGSTLGGSLTIRAIDQYGNPVPNIGVNFTIPAYPPNSTGQGVTVDSATTSFNGLASTQVTLGTAIGTYTVAAAIGGGTNIAAGVHFYENATAGPIISLKLSPIQSILPRNGSQPFSVTAFDQYQNPVPLTNSDIQWQVVNGGGSIDVNGNFNAGNTTGIYRNTVQVTVGSVGSTASVTILNESVGSNGSSGGSSSSSGGGVQTSETPTPSPTPTPNYVTVTPTPSVTVTPIPQDILDKLSQIQSGTSAGSLSTLTIDHVVINPNPVTVQAGASVIVHAQAYDVSNNPINDTQIGWALSNGAGTLAQTYGTSDSIQASKTPGNATLIAVATDQSGSKSVSVQVIIQAVPVSAQGLPITNTNIGGGHLVVKQIADQTINVPFNIVVLAEDNNNNILGTFTGPVFLQDGTSTMTPNVSDTFKNGVWNGNETIPKAIDKDIISIHGNGLSGTSNTFAVKGTNSITKTATGIGNGVQTAGTVLSKALLATLKSLQNSITGSGGWHALAQGLAIGLGLLGSAISIGLTSRKAVEAIGRNPFAKTKIQVSLIISTVVCIGIAVIGVVAGIFIK